MISTVRDEFESEFSRFMGGGTSIAVNSGTSALIASLYSLDLSSADEIITSPFTFIASSNAILIAGGKPKFVDIHLDSGLMDETKIENEINENTRGILVPHLYGRVAKMPKIIQIAEKYGLAVIEDAAQALGARCGFSCTQQCKPCDLQDGFYAGTLSDASCFSFYKTKNLSTFEGGMIFIPESSRLDAEKIRAITDQGQTRKYHHEYVGFNFRLAEPLCLIGLEKLRLHSRGFLAELGMRDETHGHYPEVVYKQPAYIKLGIKGSCPNAERKAHSIAKATGHGGPSA